MGLRVAQQSMEAHACLSGQRLLARARLRRLPRERADLVAMIGGSLLRLAVKRNTVEFLWIACAKATNVILKEPQRLKDLPVM